MKSISLFLLGMIFSLVGSVAFAADQIRYVTGYGSYSDYCSGNSSYFCVDNAKRRAIDFAERDADYQCRAMNGRLDSLTTGCYANCSPGYIPPNQDTWVNCRADCNLRCYIPEEDFEQSN